MTTAARGAAYALLTTGLVNVAAGLFTYSRLDALFVDNREANASILNAIQLGAGLLALIGFLAVTIGIVLFMIGPPAPAAPKKGAAPPERIG